MTRQQAITALTGVVGEERLLDAVRRGPFALSADMERRVREVVKRDHLGGSYESADWGETRSRARTRGNPGSVKYGWER